MEREGKHVLETPYGFCVYELGSDYCYLEDIYIDRSARRKGLASEMNEAVEIIAKHRGCKKMFGSVAVNAKGSHESLLTVLSAGYRLSHVNGNTVYFVKDL